MINEKFCELEINTSVGCIINHYTLECGNSFKKGTHQMRSTLLCVQLIPNHPHVKGYKFLPD